MTELVDTLGAAIDDVYLRINERAKLVRGPIPANGGSMPVMDYGSHPSLKAGRRDLSTRNSEVKTASGFRETRVFFQPTSFRLTLNVSNDILNGISN